MAAQPVLDDLDHASGRRRGILVADRIDNALMP
jgi:hypothetical protein